MNMTQRATISHPLNKWFWFCALVFIYMVLYIPNRNVQSYQILSNEIENKINKSESDVESEYIKSTIVNSTNITRANITPLYYVNNDRCKMPYVDPFDAESRAIYKPKAFRACSNESDLVRPIFDVNRKRYVLHINESAAAELLNSTEIEFNCYYQEVKPDAKHDTYDRLLDRIYFTQDYVVPLHVEFLILSCYKATNESHVLQTDAYSLIQYKPMLASSAKTQRAKLKSTPKQRKPSIIMFGIDSISRINFRRTMPKVYKFLQRSGWYELQGYNKVADNTFPNLMAILSGYLPESAKKNVCDIDKRGCFDKFPFIWKYLKNASYLTAYSEDASFMNTFNYLKPGFSKPPTDYYLRPFIRAIEQNMKDFTLDGWQVAYCIGRRTTNSYVYDFGKQFTQRYIGERPIWGLFWSNTFSHDAFDVPSMMELNILQYLMDFESDGIYNESIVVFFSDHGIRWGELMHLSSGFLEERLPMMFIYLPPWFRKQYPEYAKGLALNRNRLTSNYDIHNTLKHIIELGGTPNGSALPKAFDCPKCQSLFYPVNEHRICADAGIAEHWCTCEPYKRINTNWAKRIPPLVINRMNEYFVAKNISSLCSNLTLDSINKIEIKVGLDQNFHDGIPVVDLATYRTKFSVNENGADFLATVLFNNITETVDVDVETISRTNSYRKDSTCVNDKTAKLYCICKENIKTSK